MCVTNGKIGEMGKLGNLWRINLLWSYEKLYVVRIFFFLFLKRKSPCYEIFFLKYSLFFYDMKYLFFVYLFSVYVGGLRLLFHRRLEQTSY